jgi:aspartate-semialdehyde dehydrogenase
MSRTYKVAVVGATGAVGEVMLSVLAERKFPVGELVALASGRSAGGKVKSGNREVVVQDLATFDPAGSTSRSFPRAAPSRRNTRQSSPPPAPW